MANCCLASFAIGLTLGILIVSIASLCLEASDYYHYKAIEKKKKIYLENKGDKNHD